MSICLPSIVSRVLARSASQRIQRHVEAVGWLSEVQWGFRQGRSARDATLVVRILCETFGNLDKHKANRDERCSSTVGLPDGAEGATSEGDGPARCAASGAPGEAS